MDEPAHPRRPPLVRQEAIDARISPDWFRRRGSHASARRLLWHAGFSVLACAGLLAWFAQTRHGGWAWLPAVLQAASADCHRAHCAVQVRMVGADAAAISQMILDQEIAVRTAQRTHWVRLVAPDDQRAIEFPAGSRTLLVDWPSALPLPAEARIGVRQPETVLLARLFPQSRTEGARHGD